LWQTSESGKRIVLNLTISDVDEESFRLHFLSDENINFHESLIYFYSSSLSIIFKTDEFEIVSDGIYLQLPIELIVLDKEENQSFEDSEQIVIPGGTEHLLNSYDRREFGRDRVHSEKLSGFVAGTDNISSKISGYAQVDKFSSKISANLKTDNISTLTFVKTMSEDEQFAHKRATPRGRPEVDKKVTLRLESDSGEGEVFVLFDLSQGGLSFNVSSEESFSKNDTVEVLAFDSRVLDPLILGVVRSVREESKKLFRVGVQFKSDE